MKGFKQQLLAAAVGAATGIMMINSAGACTRVFMNQYPGYMVSARNLDFFGPVDPSLVITPRGILHKGGDTSNSPEWKTRYGSVVIYADNAFPMDGINEAGLAAHTQYYTNGSQEQKDNKGKPVLESRSWVSYVLDNFSTVSQAVQALQHNVQLKAKKMHIDYATDTKHMAIEDATGDSAIIEIDNGKVNIYHGKEYRVMTNPPSIPEQIKNLQKYKNADLEGIPGGQDADERFVRASYDLEHVPQPDYKSQAQGFVLAIASNTAEAPGMPDDKAGMDAAIMKDYGQYTIRKQDNKGNATYFQTLADLTHGEYYFKSLFAPSAVYVKLSDIDFTTGQPVKRIIHFNDYGKNGWEGNILSHAKPDKGSH
ncbi:choloylglycine hydrolase [Salmonella enterica subsp. enterica serovar Choleraesuis]|nr:choloylglycine hydrolase [Salmonella enterica subsp. enterica serovar Choleraesuis]